jgi:hypothetical protein
MTPVERLSRWKAAGALSDTQFDSIAAVVRKDRFSVFFELNALLSPGCAHHEQAYPVQPEAKADFGGGRSGGCRSDRQLLKRELR